MVHDRDDPGVQSSEGVQIREIRSLGKIEVKAPVQYLVIGDNSRVTVIEDGARRQVPYLAPSRPQQPLLGRDELRVRLRESLKIGGYAVLHGPAGVGKTALALDLACDRDEVLPQFPDGVLWAGLGRQGDVLTHLSIWGEKVGVRPDELPERTAEAWSIAIHRSIGLRRFLLVIDDAWSADQALLFQVGGPNCAHVLTTRIDDVAFEFGGTTFRVDELDDTQALLLLEMIAGKTVDQNLAQLCGGLPLALILIGHHLRSRADRDLLSRLQHTDERLRLKRKQPPAAAHPSIPANLPLSLQAVVELSYQWVPKEAQRVLTDLTTFPPKPNAFTEKAACEVAITTRLVLDVLLNAALLTRAVADRYTIHQVIHDYASSITSSTAAGRRMAHMYVRMLTEEDVAMTSDQFDREVTNILAALEHAYRNRMHEAVLRGVENVYPVLEQRGLYAVAQPHLEHALESARALRNQKAEVLTLLRLGNVILERGDLRHGQEYLQEGIQYAADAGLGDEVVDLLIKLGWATGMRGDLALAHIHFSDALTIAAGKRATQALQGLGWIAGLQGRHDESSAYLRRGLELARETEQSAQIAGLLQVYGWMRSLAGSYDEARQLFEECLLLSRAHGLRTDEVDALHGLGYIRSREGRHGSARDLFVEALSIASEIQYHERVPILQNLGSALRELGDLAGAESALREAVTLARQQDRPEKLSAALGELGFLKVLLGSLEEAERLLAESLELAERVTVKEPRVKALRALAVLEREKGHIAIAREILQRATRMELGNPAMLAQLRKDLGELELVAREYEAASRYFIAASAAADRTGQLELSALATYGSARSMLELGDLFAARRLAEQSVEGLREIESPRSDEVGIWLDHLTGG